MHGKAQGRAQHGEGDAGVAAGGVEEGLAGSEQAACAGIADDGRGGAVLDAAAGVGPLGLGEKGDARIEARTVWSRRMSGVFPMRSGSVEPRSDEAGRSWVAGVSIEWRRTMKLRAALPVCEIGDGRDHNPRFNILADWKAIMARKSTPKSFEQILDALRAHSFDVATFPGVAGGMLVSKHGAAAVLVPAKDSNAGTAAAFGGDAGDSGAGRDGAAA